MSTSKCFFEEQTSQSARKSRIVFKFFDGWANVFTSPKMRSKVKQLGYVDLFAGPGMYENQTLSTPVQIVQRVIERPEVASRFRSVFNDADPDHVRTLKANIESLPGIEKLAHRPIFQNLAVESDEAVIESLVSLVANGPAVLFVDPFGYKGLSIRLLANFLRGFGHDAMFFFNYRRLNAAMNNDLFAPWVDAVFSAERAHQLRQTLTGLSPDARERAIVDAMIEALRVEAGASSPPPFRFADPAIDRTSHYIFGASKADLGVSIMKTVMAGESTGSDDGVMSFSDDPHAGDAPTLFSALDYLKDELLAAFEGRALSFEDVLVAHARPESDYLPRNYRDALNELEAERRITVEPIAAKRRRGTTITMGPHTLITFPAKNV